MSFPQILLQTDSEALKLLEHRARVFDSCVAESIITASKTCIPRNINNSEKARMSCNIRRQVHQAEKNTTHHKLDSDIADTRSLLNASAQTAKDLKAHLKELTDKKKEAGKAPRNSQVLSDKFNIPIPKIQGGSMTTKAAFELNPCSPTPNEKDIEMQEIAPVDILFVNHTETPTQHDNSSLFQPPVLPGNAPTGVGLPLEVSAPYDSEEIRYHPSDRV